MRLLDYIVERASDNLAANYMDKVASAMYKEELLEKEAKAKAVKQIVRFIRDLAVKGKRGGQDLYNNAARNQKPGMWTNIKRKGEDVIRHGGDMLEDSKDWVNRTIKTAPKNIKRKGQDIATSAKRGMRDLPNKAKDTYEDAKTAAKRFFNKD